MAVEIGPGFSPGEPRRLFSPISGVLGSLAVPYYDVTPDGRGFYMVRSASIDRAPGAGQLVIVENWLTEVEQKMAAVRE